MPFHLSWAVFIPVFKIFGVVAVGLLFRRYSTVDAKSVTNLTMQVFVPALAFSSIMSHHIELVDFWAMVGSAVIVMLGTGALAVAAFGALGIRSRGLLLPVMFLNAANLPFPLLEDVFGSAGLFRGVLYYTATCTLVFSLGLYIASGRGHFRELAKEPVLPAVGLALVFNFLGVQPPSAIMDVVHLMGEAAIPLVLFMFGYTLYSVRVSHLGKTALASTLRIAGGLAMGIVAVRLLHLEGLNREIVLLYSIMPSAVVNVLISKKYEADPELVASTVFLTTAVSLVTIPMMLAYLGR